MQFIMFTKHLEGLDLAGLIQALTGLGLDGADLCVRPGYPVDPQNVASALPRAARQFAEAGLEIPLVTAPGDFVRPDMDYADRLYGACGEAGVRHIKLGYWHWSAEQHYWDQVDQIRSWVEGFEELSRKHGVQSVVHNHSGNSMGLNSCAAMNIVRGFDPRLVGVFSDPGHLSICGEPAAMALDIVRDYLAVVAFKDMVQRRSVRNGRYTWGKSVVRLGQGLVDWSAVLHALKRLDFEGAISFHSEYSGEDVETVVDLTRIDVRFINTLREAM